MMGGDHGRISAASKVAAKQIGCKVFKGSPYYRKEGVYLSNAALPDRENCDARQCLIQFHV